MKTNITCSYEHYISGLAFFWCTHVFLCAVIGLGFLHSSCQHVEEHCTDTLGAWSKKNMPGGWKSTLSSSLWAIGQISAHAHSHLLMCVLLGDGTCFPSEQWTCVPTPMTSCRSTGTILRRHTWTRPRGSTEHRRRPTCSRTESKTTWNM